MVDTAKNKLSAIQFSLLFLAYLPPGRYAGYPGPWGIGLNTLKQRYVRYYPEVFADLRFERPIRLPGFPGVCREGELLFECLKKYVGEPNGPVELFEDGLWWLRFPLQFQERLKNLPCLQEVPPELLAIMQKLTRVAARDKLIELRLKIGEPKSA